MENHHFLCWGLLANWKVGGMEAYLADPNQVVMLDGGLATELETRGCDLLDPLWSGKVLLESPQRIRDVALAYLRAGARCIITASYQITPQSLMEHRGLTEDAAVAAIEESVRIAQSVRERHLKEKPQAAPVFVAGSVGPYGAYLADGSEYRGDYVRSAEEFKEFHRLRIAALLRAGADVLAIETQPSAAEVRAIVALLQEEHPNCRAWVSFTTSRISPVEAISDGTKWADIISFLEKAPQVVAVGVNCIPMAEASAVLAHLHTLTTMPLVVYTNSGESYDTVTRTWHPIPMRDGTTLSLAALAREWASHGARLVGGCCRTGPSDIAGAAAALDSAGFVV
ncbi:homocysteine_S-methyltransferase_-_putative [Leishmania infantum]|uniref:Homocysteine_S-methyltransferase_-_putative n=4 Tax=Leishmania donovani species complex TaxID=38574 RepID=A0A6L0XSY3_LEIIN|nr:homocysteine S-methyltransferase, putative [Leishmania donovani]CAC9553129.1 homocysteine_S-methyltransferase_-_putative [Leishmania infantum]SUZ47045.1 homocysteine_S-methyltransferase_-_putative [Leishmania infantum]